MIEIIPHTSGHVPGPGLYSIEMNIAGWHAVATKADGRA